MNGLALSEIEQHLLIAVCDFRSPAGSIGPVCLEEGEREVRGKQSVPLSIATSLGEEQTYGGSSKSHINSTIGTFQCPVMLTESLLLNPRDNLVGRQVAPLGVVLGLAQLYHAKQMALDVAACNQTYKVSTGKPAVHEQIVESDALLDGVLYHLDSLVGLLHGVLPDTFLHDLALVFLAETLTTLLACQTLLALRIPAFFSVKREVEHQLAQSVCIEQCQTLVPKDCLVLQMGEYLSEQLCLTATLRSIRIVDDQTDRMVVRSLAATADLTQQLQVHRIHQLAPLNITIIHKTIEHVLLTTEQAA